MRSLRATHLILLVTIALSLSGCDLVVKSTDFSRLDPLNVGIQRTQLVIGTIAAILCCWGNVLGVWTAAGKGYFTVRISVALLPTLSMFFIDASELVLMYVTQLTVLNLAIAAWRYAPRERPIRWSSLVEARLTSFSLRDTMAAMFLFGLALALFTNIHPEPYHGRRTFVIAGIIGAVTGLAAFFGLAFGMLLMFVIMVLTAGYIGIDIFTYRNKPTLDWLVAPWPPFLATALTTIVFWGLRTASWSSCPQNQNGRPAFQLRKSASRSKRATGLAVTAIFASTAIPLTWIYYSLWTKAPYPPMTPMQSNAFGNIVRIGGEWKTDWNRRNPKTADLQKFVTQNAASLKAVRTELAKPWRVELADRFDERWEDHSALRNVADGLLAEAEVARLGGETMDSATTSLQVLNIGHRTCKGAHFVYFLIGMAIEDGGIYQLSRARNQLQPDELAFVIESLRQLDSSFPSAGEWKPVNRAWFDRATTWHKRLHDRIYCEWITDYAQADERMAQNAHHRSRAALRLLYTDLALRQFQAKHGEYPESLQELVPELLEQVPLDPFTDKPLSYRREPDGSFTLYSVGPDKKDDNGLIQAWDPNKPADFLLDGINNERQ